MMRVSTDDTVYRVDSRWLGPQGITIARVGVRYQAVGLGFLLWVPAAMAMSLAGINGLTGLLASVAATVTCTAAIMHHVDHDRPLQAQLTVLLHEITAPRPTPRPAGIRTVVDWRRIPITRLPPRPPRPTPKGAR